MKIDLRSITEKIIQFRTIGIGHNTTIPRIYLKRLALKRQNSRKYFFGRPPMNKGI